MAMGVVSDSDFEAQLKNVSPKETESNGESDQNVVNQDDGTSDSPIDTLDASSESDLPSPNTTGAPNVISLIPTRGRGKGNVEVPSTLRALIAGTAAVEGRQEALNLARMFNLSDSSVSAYSNGSSSTTSYNEPKKEIKDVINTRKRHASKKALTRLHKTLDQIGDDKLESLGAKDLASIAKDLAGVVKIMTPEESHQSGPLVAFQLFAPETKHIETYETIVAVE